MSVKLCNKFIIPIINITKKEHITEYNEHIKDIIDNLESIKDIYSICSYLMNICCEEYFKLSKNEYLEMKKFIDNDIDIIESTLAPMNGYFDSYKKCLCYYEEFDEKIIKSYFNIWYIKFFYLLDKDIKLNIHNINILMNIFINLCENSGIGCNKKIKIKYMICIIILYLLFITNTRHDSSVTLGYMGNFDLRPNFPANPMGSSGSLWARLYFP